jgi:hypothetical protein
LRPAPEWAQERLVNQMTNDEQMNRQSLEKELRSPSARR